MPGQVTVSFRGICLFAIRDRKIFEVLLPEAESTQPRESKTPGLHLDNHVARKHWAKVLRTDTNKHIPIKERWVTIHAVGATEGPASVKLSTLPRLPSELEVDRKAPHASIKVKGGKVSTKKAKGGNRAFTFEGNSNRHDHVDLVFDTKVTVRIQDEADPIILEPKDNPRLYVYNFDSAFPDTAALESGTSSGGPVIRDDDFKWLYLLAAPPGPDPNKLEKWRAGVLPCPASVEPIKKSGTRFQLMTVAGSTCYPATINDD